VLVLRCTRKLLRRLDAAEDPAPSSTWLGDWYANPVSVGRARLILCISEKTLLPVVVPARDLHSLGARLAAATGEVLRGLGVAEALVKAEVDRMTPVVFAPTKSRVVLGSLNEFAWLLQGQLNPGRSLLDVSLELSQTPCGPIKDFPDRVTVALFRGRSPLTLVR